MAVAEAALLILLVSHTSATAASNNCRGTEGRRASNRTDSSRTPPTRACLHERVCVGLEGGRKQHQCFVRPQFGAVVFYECFTYFGVITHTRAIRSCGANNAINNRVNHAKLVV